MTLLRYILCFFKFHELEYKYNVIFKSEDKRLVCYKCPHCAETKFKIHYTGKKDPTYKNVGDKFK